MSSIETQELSGTLNNTNSLRGTLNGDNNLSGALSNARSGGSSGGSETIIIDLSELNDEYWDSAMTVTQENYPNAWASIKNAFEKAHINTQNDKGTTNTILIKSMYDNKPVYFGVNAYYQGREYASASSSSVRYFQYNDIYANEGKVCIDQLAITDTFSYGAEDWNNRFNVSVTSMEMTMVNANND